MKLFFIIFLLAPLLSVCQTKQVKLKVVQVMPYCGGAKPSKNIQDKNVAAPYACKKLVFVSDQQKVDSLATNAKGELSIKLPYGDYKFFEPWKYYRKIPEGMAEDNLQMDCLEKEWGSEDLRIIVTKKGTQIQNNLKFPKCPHQFPCLINKHLPR
ncbi:MAG: hypothetical protein K0R26_1152 [Bacteroidota bacterium]|jgi:hypothetical protein|nr:hypothetical protein [Bacteroidota bacterium]